jgi:hypothetical protein
VTPALQLTTVLRRLGFGGVLPAPPADDASPAPAAPQVDLAEVLARARAAGAHESACAALAELWPGMDPRTQAQVASPLQAEAGTGVVRLGTAAARQTDQTSCGSAVLVMLAAAGDPLLALWLVTGELCAGYLPPQAYDTGPESGVVRRFGAAQYAMKRSSVRGALLGLPWPAAFGTPPWGAARVAGFPGVSYRSLLVDDTRHDEITAVLDRAGRALDRGIPVPLYVGGDLTGGIAAAVPRHVVLLTGRDGDVVSVYEPSEGRLHEVPLSTLVHPDGPAPALGGWWHVCWAVLPVRWPLR